MPHLLKCRAFRLGLEESILGERPTTKERKEKRKEDRKFVPVVTKKNRLLFFLKSVTVRLRLWIRYKLDRVLTWTLGL